LPAARLIGRTPFSAANASPCREYIPAMHRPDAAPSVSASAP
jgi:hypothetical protein